MSVCLGDKVKDKVTGLTGIVMAKTMWLNGCVRLCVQPVNVEKGKPAESVPFDEPQVEIIKENAVKPGVPLPETMLILRARHQEKPKEQTTRRTGGDRDDSVAHSRSNY